MATTRSINMIGIDLHAYRTFIHYKRQELRHAYKRHKVYRKTYRELSALSERCLKDLGIPRSAIKNMALEAAYDC